MVSNVARRIVIRTYKFGTAKKKLSPSVNNELERVWKDAIAASFEILDAKLPLGV
jgi:hypothetical protein